MQFKIRAAGVLAVTASAVALMGAPAFAQTGPSGNINGLGNLGVLNGNTVNVPLSMPISLCGGALAILGFAEAGCRGGAEVIVDSGNTTSYGHGHGRGFGFGF